MFVPLLFSLITYFGMGFAAGFGHFMFFLLVLCCAVLVGASFGFFFGCVFDNMESANALAGIVVFIPLMFNGIVRNIGDCPGYLRWIADVSHFRYLAEALCHNEFDH